ncbi:ABC transporter ATP-binding protein [Kribbella sp. NBC_00359]|uniref:ABC transporter ATP-binding protein n=1 Tax=Kribbella sp. NBC_00359 TaxID=2975966 RepID=UPI002E1E558C
MPGIRLDSVSKVYDGDHLAVDELSLEVADGEFMVLLGPSGCGKSTVLRMIAGLEPITAGDLWFGRTHANRLQPKDRGVAMVFENGALYPNRTVRENIMFPLLVAGEEPAEASVKAAELARILGIENAIDQLPWTLSGGQRQRVAIGRAIVRRPEIFLMDEPLSNLDATMRTELRQEIGAMSKDLKATTVYVTHDHVEAFTLADRIAIMRNGRIEDAGTPEQVYADPGTAFVAGFLGTPRINLISAVVRVTAHHRVALDFGTQSISLPPVDRRSLILSHHDGATVIVGIRPDALTLTPTTETDNWLTGRLRALEFHGNQWFAFIESDLNLVNPDLVGQPPPTLPTTLVAPPTPHRRSLRSPRRPQPPEPPPCTPTHRRSDLIVQLDAPTSLRPPTPIRAAVDPTRLHLFTQSGHQVARRPRKP